MTDTESIYKLPITGRRDGRKGVVVGFADILDDDFSKEVISSRRWFLTGKGYPARWVRKNECIPTQNITLHRIVFEHYYGSIPDGMLVDHIDRNPLNNLPDNLRAATLTINAANRKVGNKTGFRGVYFSPTRNKFVASIVVKGTPVFFGHHETARQAADAINSAYQKHYPGVHIPNP